jgi:hypothetical protein
MFPAHLATREALDKYQEKETAREQARDDAEAAATAEAYDAAPKHHIVVLEGYIRSSCITSDILLIKMSLRTRDTYSKRVRP